MKVGNDDTSAILSVGIEETLVQQDDSSAEAMERQESGLGSKYDCKTTDPKSLGDDDAKMAKMISDYGREALGMVEEIVRTPNILVSIKKTYTTTVSKLLSSFSPFLRHKSNSGRSL